MWTRASTSSPTLHRQLPALRPIRAPLHCRSRAVPPARRCAPCKRWQQTPQTRHGGPRPRGSTPSSTAVAQGSGKRFFPASDSTARRRPVLQYEHCCASRRATRVRNPVAHSSALALGAGIPSAARDRARASPLQAPSGPTVLASP